MTVSSGHVDEEEEDDDDSKDDNEDEDEESAELSERGDNALRTLSKADLKLLKDSRQGEEEADDDEKLLDDSGNC